VLRGVILLRLTIGEEDEIEDINVRLKHHNMALNGTTCNDRTSWNNKMRVSEEKKMNGKRIKYKRN